jgi:hypothetical protein
LTEDKSDLPWFRLRYSDGSEGEIHATNAVALYEHDFKASFLAGTDTDGAVQPSVNEGPDESPPSSIKEELPSNIAKPSGTSDAITKVLATEWGQKNLRTWREIQGALKNCGYQFGRRAISGALTNLVKSNKLRRQKIGDEFCYGLPLGQV